MGQLPLRLALEPLLPSRFPAGAERLFRLGYRLRLPNGPIITTHDPLLRVFGAEVVTLVGTEDHEEAVQLESFTPGRELSMVPEGLDDDGDPVVAVWDGERTYRAGYLPCDVAAHHAAAAEQGLSLSLLSLVEARAALDDRRRQLEMFLYAPAMVRLTRPRRAPARLAERPARRRLVLVLGADDRVRWWDPAGDTGPAEADDLPVSAELRRKLRELSRSYEDVRQRQAAAASGYERAELAWEGSELMETGIRLWRRVRVELGTRYAIGFMTPTMERAAWSPRELEPDEDDECPF